MKVAQVLKKVMCQAVAASGLVGFAVLFVSIPPVFAWTVDGSKCSGSAGCVCGRCTPACDIASEGFPVCMQGCCQDCSKSGNVSRGSCGDTPGWYLTDPYWGCCVDIPQATWPTCVCPVDSLPEVTNLTSSAGTTDVPVNRSLTLSWTGLATESWKGIYNTDVVYNNENSSGACWNSNHLEDKKYEVKIGTTIQGTVATSVGFTPSQYATEYTWCVRAVNPGSYSGDQYAKNQTLCPVYGPWRCATFVTKSAAVCGDGQCNQTSEKCEYLISGTPLIFTCPDHDSLPPSSGGYCREESLYPGSGCTYCGDGVKNGNEECDGSSGTCPSGVCTSSCTCQGEPGSFCGDGTVDAGDGELCDPPGSTCFNGMTCSASCRCPKVPRPECGDGKCDSGETCDPNRHNPDIICGGLSDPTSGSCRSDCSFCGDGFRNEAEECDSRASPTGCSSGSRCNSLCDCVGCSCNCACPSQDPISAPSLSSPSDSATRISTARIEFSWSAIPSSEWDGVTGVSCDRTSDSNSDGTCDCDFIYDYNADRRYEVVIVREGSTLPSTHEACPYCEKTVRTSWTYDSRSSLLPVGFPLSPGTDYVWAVRGVNPGGGGGDIDCTRYGEWSVRRFRTSYAPTVDSVTVLADDHITCFLPASGGKPGAPSRWTGDYDVSMSLYSTPSAEMNAVNSSSFENSGDEVSQGLTVDQESLDQVLAAYSLSRPNNPISIKITVSDRDGADDIEKVWLDVGNAPGNLCNNFSDDFVSLGAAGSTWWSICPSGSNGSCSSSSLTACNNEPGCRWDYSSRRCVSGSCQICSKTKQAKNYIVDEVSGPRISGNSVTYIYTITFENTYEQGIQALYGMAFDGALYSGVGDGLNPSRTAGDSWGFDFRGPSTEISMYHIEGTPANQVELSSIVSYDLSGVRHIYGREYSVERGGAEIYSNTTDLDDVWFNMGLSTGLESGRARTGQDTVSLTISDIQGGDAVLADDLRDDLACNSSRGEGEIAVGMPWLETFGGSVYGYGGFYDPIPSGPNNHALSQYWIGGNSSGFFNAGLPSLNGWYSLPYNDWNRNEWRTDSVRDELNWYDELKSLALVSAWMGSVDGAKMQEIDSSEVRTAVSGPVEGMYEVSGSSGDRVEINTGDVCHGRKLFFIPAGVDLKIDSNFGVSDVNSACLFILEQGTVELGQGNDQPDVSSSDVLHGFVVVSDGDLELEADRTFPFPDRLELYGSVFADSTNFSNRDLIWEDNQGNPSVTISYDPRVLTLFRDMIGRRPYSELECGIVKESASCRDWVAVP